MHAGPHEKPSALVVQGRIRNRLIEYLELASSFEAQREYQVSVEIAHVPNEVINQWQDWVGDDPGAHDWMPEVFTQAELDALWAFHRVWDSVAKATPEPLPNILDTQKLPAWGDLRDAASTCLAVLMKRGRTSHDGGGEDEPR